MGLDPRTGRVRWRDRWASAERYVLGETSGPITSGSFRACAPDGMTPASIMTGDDQGTYAAGRLYTVDA